VGLERRLRDDLNRDAEEVVPDVERNLGAVQARAHRRSSVAGPMILVAAALIVVVIVYRFGGTSTGIGAPTPSVVSSPVVNPSGSPVIYDEIAGTYTVTLASSDAGVDANHLAGKWTMRLLPDGEMLLSPPPTFVYGSLAPSGIAFSTAADRFRTNLFYNDFCNSVGTYTWVLQGGRLSFAPDVETCAARQTLLSTTTWQAAP
jgi:hypothetical protein